LHSVCKQIETETNFCSANRSRANRRTCAGQLYWCRLHRCEINFRFVSNTKLFYFSFTTHSEHSTLFQYIFTIYFTLLRVLGLFPLAEIITHLNCYCHCHCQCQLHSALTHSASNAFSAVKQMRHMDNVTSKKANAYTPISLSSTWDVQHRTDEKNRRYKIWVVCSSCLCSSACFEIRISSIACDSEHSVHMDAKI